MKQLVLFLVLLVAGGLYAQDTTSHWCGAHKKYLRAMGSNLNFATKMEALNNTDDHQELGAIVIPVVVHVLYGDTFDIPPMWEIEGQIDALTRDFNAENLDVNNTPDEFRKVVGDMNLVFKLATKDPEGKATNGVTYTQSDKKYYSMNKEDAKYDDAGGKTAWDTKKYLNIWVCNLEYRLLGYAQFPGDYPPTDGVVLDFSAFGFVDSVDVEMSNKINKDSTHYWTETIAVYNRVVHHEIGHWLGLRHIWGDANCGNDFVSDTPDQEGPHRWCFDEINTCGAGYKNDKNDLPCNYMDYVDSECMVMFTEGQKRRAMKALRLYRRGIVKYGNKLTR